MHTRLLAGVGLGVSAGDGGSGLDLEAAVDTVVELLLAREASPVQTIAIEQLAKLTGALGRERWAALRKQSGSPTLAARERSRLGALVDPLGLFRGSPLVENDERDREALSAATKLAELASELLGNAGADDGAPPLLSQEELRRFNTLLLRKTWERRDDLQVVTRRFAAKLLDDTAQRLYEGRR